MIVNGEIDNHTDGWMDGVELLQHSRRFLSSLCVCNEKMTVGEGGGGQTLIYHSSPGFTLLIFHSLFAFLLSCFLSLSASDHAVCLSK